MKPKMLMLCLIYSIVADALAQKTLTEIKTNCAANSRPAFIKITSKEEMTVTSPTFTRICDACL